MNTQSTINKRTWPRNIQKSVECRKRDVVIRLSDWSRCTDEPAYDVEVYEHGVYDFNLSKVFSTREGKKQAREAAIKFAAEQFANLVK